MGKAMVADGAGLAVLPRFSVDGDVLQRSGDITCRRIAGVDGSVSLVLRFVRPLGCRPSCGICGTSCWHVPLRCRRPDSWHLEQVLTRLADLAK
jgi:hypothetical protein